MRAKPFVVAALLFHSSATFAAEPMAPSDIQATFFNGQPFTAATLSGVKFKMTFTPDGKMTREPLAQSGSKSAGTWKLNTQGFCTRWGRAKGSCFTVVPLAKINGRLKELRPLSQSQLLSGPNNDLIAAHCCARFVIVAEDFRLHLSAQSNSRNRASISSRDREE